MNFKFVFLSLILLIGCELDPNQGSNNDGRDDNRQRDERTLESEDVTEFEFIDQLLAQARPYEFAKVHVEVDLIMRDNDLIVADESGQLLVDVDERFLGLRAGDSITIYGVVDFERDGSIELYATRVVKGSESFDIPFHSDR